MDLKLEGYEVCREFLMIRNLRTKGKNSGIRHCVQSDIVTSNTPTDEWFTNLKATNINPPKY